MPEESDRVTRLLERAEQPTWDVDPFDEVREIAADHPEDLANLIRAASTRLVGPWATRLLHAALCLLPLDEFPAAAGDAVATLRERPRDEVTRQLIEYISIQCPSALHPHLTVLFELYADDLRFGQWPWRESGTTHLGFLRRVLEDPTRTEEGQKAWLALLETRHPDALSWAEEQARRGGWSDALSWMLDDVGYEMRDGNIGKLYVDQPFHIIFPMSYFPDALKEPIYLRKTHPTWSLPTTGAPVMEFGGSGEGGCSVCGGRLHRMISLDPIPEDLRVVGKQTLELATCLSCLGWEQQRLFYEHDVAGKPHNVGYDGPLVVPEFPVGPLPPTEVSLVTTPPRWRWQDFGWGYGGENMNRIGGFPRWVQDPEYPECPGCERTMRLLMQLDSDLPDADGNEWLWGSGGMCYVSWCDHCAISGFLWQCT